MIRLSSWYGSLDFVDDLSNPLLSESGMVLPNDPATRVAG